MAKHVENFLFGLCFGMGFFLAKAALDLIAQFIARAH